MRHLDRDCGLDEQVDSGKADDDDRGLNLRELRLFEYSAYLQHARSRPQAKGRSASTSTCYELQPTSLAVFSLHALAVSRLPCDNSSGATSSISQTS